MCSSDLFPEISPSSGEQSNLISCSGCQLLRYDSAIKQTKIILKKIIILTLETGSLTGI